MILWQGIFVQFEKNMLLMCMVLQLMWRRDSCCTGLIIRRNLRFLSLNSFYVFDRIYFIQYLTSFSSVDTRPHLCAQMEINPSAFLLVFGDFNVHHRDWLNYFGETGRYDKPCYIFLSQATLLRWLTFPIGSLWLVQSCSFRFIHFFWP